MTRISTALVAAMACVGMPAFAGGMGAPEAPPVYVPIAPVAPAGIDWTGFYGGAQIAYGDVEVSDAATGEGEGALYGVFGGYRYDFGDFIVGGEIDYDMADIDIAGVGTLDSVARAGLEAGYDAGPAVIYATLGMAYATVDGPSADLDGYGHFYGIGMDYAVTDSVTIGAEVLQHQFRDFNDTTDLSVDAMTFGLNAALRF